MSVMWKKHQKLIFAQVAGIAGVGALMLAYLRYQQTGIIQEPTFGSFLGFGILLFAAEVKCLRDWLKAKKTAQPVEQ